MTDFVATERSSYKKWSREILRYSDLDPVGHVNNNAYGQLVENARTLLFDDAQKISGQNNKEIQTKDNRTHCYDNIIGPKPTFNFTAIQR